MGPPATTPQDPQDRCVLSSHSSKTKEKEKEEKGSPSFRLVLK
jgi:hypothetical protein